MQNIPINIYIWTQSVGEVQICDQFYFWVFVRLGNIPVFFLVCSEQGTFSESIWKGKLLKYKAQTIIFALSNTLVTAVRFLKNSVGVA